MAERAKVLVPISYTFKMGKRAIDLVPISYTFNMGNRAKVRLYREGLGRHSKIPARLADVLTGPCHQKQGFWVGKYPARLVNVLTGQCHQK